MSTSIEIILIAPKEYLDFTGNVVENLKASGLKSICFDVEEFLTKEYQERPSRFFISIGDSDENAFSKKVLPHLIESKNEHGICFGYNKSHAIVYSEVEYGHIDSLKDWYNQISEKFKKLKKKRMSQDKTSNIMSRAGRTAAVFIERTLLLNPLQFFLGGIGSLFSTRTHRKKIKHHHTQLALANFFSDHFDKWVKDDKRSVD